MSHNKLPEDKLKSLFLLYPIFLSAVFLVSRQLSLKRVAVLIAIYLLSVALNLKNLKFLLDRVRLFRIYMIKIGLDIKKRLIFLFVGILLLILINERINFLYQIIYIAVFISTDTYIGHLGEKYRQLLGKE